MVKYLAAAVLLGLGLVNDIRGAEPVVSRRQAGDLAIQSRAILGKYCGACHKDGSALSSLSVLDHKQLVGLQSPVPFAAKVSNDTWSRPSDCASMTMVLSGPTQIRCRSLS